jgi:hypothetical protein
METPKAKVQDIGSVDIQRHGDGFSCVVHCAPNCRNSDGSASALVPACEMSTIAALDRAYCRVSTVPGLDCSGPGGGGDGDGSAGALPCANVPPILLPLKFVVAQEVTGDQLCDVFVPLFADYLQNSAFAYDLLTAGGVTGNTPATVTIVSQNAASYHRTPLHRLVVGWDLEDTTPLDAQFAPYFRPFAGRLATASWSTCALVAGEPRCWGHSVQGSPAAGNEPIHWLAAGQLDRCVLRPGKVNCWGFYGSDMDLDALAVGVGDLNYCALTTDKKVVCWGNNQFGQNNVPVGLQNVTQLETRANASCALSEGTVRCWGDLHLSPSDPWSLEVPADLEPTRALSLGGDHACVVLRTGAPRCWGASQLGQLNVPADIHAVTDIRAGFGFTCALVSGNVRCWGDNSLHQIDVPADLGKVADLYTGDSHTCAVTVAGKLRCWGSNADGQLTMPADVAAYVFR